MQLKLRVARDWRNVVVTLTDGCWPSVDGCLLSEVVPEPAVWFKVVVLRCVNIDCAQRVISWNFVSNESRQCSLMAPHEGDTPPSWMDELASVFELAEALFEAGSTASVNLRRLKVEQKTWARLLQSYVLPLVSFVASDRPSLEEAISCQSTVLANLDTAITATVTRTTEVKRQLTELRANLLPLVLDWARAGQTSRLFLEHLIADIKKIENKTRSKIESFSLSLRCSTATESIPPISAAECATSEQLLMDMLTLRSQLVECLLATEGGEDEMTESQKQYLSLHKELDTLREGGTTTSDRKVLALRVREYLQQAVTSGGVGHSHPSHHHLSTTRYQTSRDKLNIVLSEPRTAVAITHQQFCSEFHSTWFEEFLVVDGPSVTTTPNATLYNERLEGSVNRPLLLQSVKRHIDTMLDVIADHFGNRDVDFSQRMQLAYEKVFFDMFHRDLMAMYSDSEKKAVECLQLNAMGAALLSVDPSLPPAIATLFRPIGFEYIVQRYQEIRGNASPLPWQQTCSQDYIEHFGGLIFDLECLLQVHSPLEKLQLLTSAFRKLMASLSALQERVVSCDDLLPVMVGALLRAHPKLLADIHINTIFLNDFIAPFLSSGWHGYSLTFFSSAIKIISEF